MTEDAANRHKAEKGGISSISGKSCLGPSVSEVINYNVILEVRKYVEGMKDATQLLDLLAAEGSNEIEPTKAVAGRQALYPEVRSYHCIFHGLIICISTSQRPRWPQE